MFNSSRSSSSPHTNNVSLYNNVSEITGNGISRSFNRPKITSTPLMKRETIFATPPKYSLLSPKRYSLSEIATPPRSNRRDLSKSVAIGPLLASTKYNVNVSTYEDTKSPGLASRIVQYNEEAERERQQARPPTHQAKYGSPGLFPVVHLFKKKLPLLEPKPRRVTVRIASPEYSRHHTQEYNRKLLEGIVKPSSPASRGNLFANSPPSSSTRSVLDALKEISRKRIHANEEYDLNVDSGKRLRTMSNGESSKRLRDTSPLNETPSPSKPTSKKICMYDEYAASCSSMDFAFKNTDQSRPKRKSISISTLTENPKESKQVKLINAETQTANEVTEVTEPSQDSDKEDQNKEEEVVKKKSPLKIFDDAPLERIRKNRLAALMGSLTGKEPVLLPKPDYASILDAEVEGSEAANAKTTEKPLISILSSPKKLSPTRLNKHVHFSVPESTSQTDISTTMSTLSFSTTPSTASVTTPGSSASETNVTLVISNKATTETPAPPSSPVGAQPVVYDPVASGSVSGSNSSSATSIVSKESSSSSLIVESPKSNFTVPSFQFKPPATSVLALPTGATLSNASMSVPSSTQLTFPASGTVTSNPPTPATTTPPKVGGFKFDLSKPVAAVSTAATTTVVPTFSLVSTVQSNAKKPTFDFGSTAPNASPSTTTATFGFGAKAIAPATTGSVPFASNLTFGTVTTSAVTGSVIPTFKFGGSSTESKTVAPPGFPLSHSNTTTFGATSTTTSAPTFASSSQVSSTTVTSVPAYSTAGAPFFSFSAPKPTSASGLGAPAYTAPSSMPFGAPLVPSSGFGTAVSTSSFLSTSSSLPSAVPAATTTASSFGGGFGSSTVTSSGFNSGSAPMFSANKSVMPFGVSTCATPTFGTVSSANSSPFAKSNAAPFGASTTQSTFGTATTTSSFGTSSAFGATTTASSSTFGASNTSSGFGNKTSGFGTAPNNSNIFGGAVNTQPSGFGTATSKPMFGTSTSSPFGSTVKTTAAPTFAAGSTPSFSFGAAKTTASSSFGSGGSFGTTTTVSTGFGNPTASTFGTGNSFGSSSSFGSGNAFTANSTPAFGVATTSAQPSGFGATPTPSFGSGNTGFNATDKGSMFGSPSANPSFGSGASSSFGNSSSSGFGAPNNTSGFGTSAGNSAFSKPQTNQNAFSSTPNTFGQSGGFGNAQPAVPSFGVANPPNSQSGMFNFGASSAPKPPGVFSFGAGASNEIPKPSFNFSGGTTAPPAFGSSAAPSFGSGAPAQFAATGIPQFNPPQAGMFSIGSGSSTGKSRTHLKPKRRT